MGKPLVIALTTAFLPKIGGTETSVDRVSRAFAAHGHEVVVVAPAGADVAAEKAFDDAYPLRVVRVRSPETKIAALSRNDASAAASSGIPLMYGGNQAFRWLDTWRAAWLSAKTLLAYHAAGREILRSVRPDKIVFNCQSVTMIAVAAFLRPWCRTRPRIVFINGFVLQPTGSRLADSLIAAALRLANRILCVSEASRAVLITGFSVRPDRIDTYRTWLSPEAGRASSAVSESRARRGDGLRLQVLYVGRIEQHKGIVDLIRASGDAAFDLAVAGSGAPELEAELRRAPGIKYLGAVEKPALWDVYAESDMLIMPSHWAEGFGNVIVEAAACGLPIIGTKMGGIPEALRGLPHHRLIRPADPEAIRAAIQDLGQEIRRNGPQKVSSDIRRAYEAKFKADGFQKFLDAAYGSVVSLEGKF